MLTIVAILLLPITLPAGVCAIGFDPVPGFATGRDTFCDRSDEVHRDGSGGFTREYS